jgi:cell division septum initiation protein DivIVA
VADSRIKGRVKGLLGGPPPNEAYQEPAYQESEPQYVDMTPGLPDPDAQRKALQVLNLAQRTADGHVATAQQQADAIRAAAQASAEQTGREAAAHAEQVRQDAAKTMADAKAAAEKIVQTAQAKADELERDAQRQYDEIVGSLETKRAALAEQIDGLQEFDRDYRSRLRTFMRGQLDALGDEQPASTKPAKPAQRAGEAATAGAVLG